VTHPHRSTPSRAVFLSAWTEFCRGEGRHEYWRRFGDYLFRTPHARFRASFYRFLPAFEHAAASAAPAPVYRADC
jgi:hypothetical protein